MTSKRDGQLIAIADCIRELTRPYTHTERRLLRIGKRQITRLHYVRCESLLIQLREALTPGADGSEPSPGGDPPMPINAGAIIALTIIETGARTACKQLALPEGSSPESALHALAGAATRISDSDLTRLAADTARWHHLARAETGWEERPRNLRDPCPHCGKKSLCVRVDASAAWCQACGADWDAATIGVLAAMLTSHTA